MDSRKRQFFENIKIEVANATSIIKDILFHVSNSLEKMVFQLTVEIIK